MPFAFLHFMKLTVMVGSLGYKLRRLGSITPMYPRGATGAMPGDVQIMTNLNSSARNGLLSCKVDPLTNKINAP